MLPRGQPSVQPEPINPDLFFRSDESIDGAGKTEQPPHEAYAASMPSSGATGISDIAASRDFSQLNVPVSYVPLGDGFGKGRFNGRGDVTQPGSGGGIEGDYDTARYNGGPSLRSHLGPSGLSIGDPPAGLLDQAANGALGKAQRGHLAAEPQGEVEGDASQAAIAGMFLQSASSIDEAELYGGQPLDFLRSRPHR